MWRTSGEAPTSSAAGITACFKSLFDPPSPAGTAGVCVASTFHLPFETSCLRAGSLRFGARQTSNSLEFAANVCEHVPPYRKTTGHHDQPLCGRGSAYRYLITTLLPTTVMLWIVTALPDCIR